METLTIDLKKKKSFEIGQQGDHNALCIHFINMKNVGTNKKYIYYTIDGIENCVPLTNDRFIVGYPLTAHSGIASAQLISKLNDNSIIKLSNVFAMNIKESKGYKDSGKYPVDPNIQSSYDLLDDLIDQTQDLINNYNYATLMEKLTQASSEATTSATTAKKCADELKNSTDFINTLDDKVAAQDGKIEKIEASTSHITTKQNTKIAALQTRMSEFTSLKDGSTTGDAELIDARIGADGTKYPSAGDAMRGQVEQLNEDLVTEKNSSLGTKMFVILNESITFENGLINTVNGNKEISNDFECSDFIEVYSDRKYFLDQAYSYACLYDVQKNYIKYDGYATKDFIFDENIKFVRLTKEKNNINDKFGYYNFNNYNIFDVMNGELTYNTVYYKNRALSFEGDQSVLSGYSATPYLPIKENVVLVLTNGFSTTCFYDESFKFIESKAYSNELSVPSNSRYFRTCKDDLYENQSIKVKTLKDPNEYIATTSTGLRAIVSKAIKHKNSKVYVKSGTYDLLKEFENEINADSSDQYGIALSNGVHIIFESGCKVTALYNGQSSNVANNFAPFFITGNGGFTLENLYIESSNCRYCVHDEGGSISDYYTNKYINCKMIHDDTNCVTKAYPQCIGGGLGTHGYIYINNCYFESKRLANYADEVVSYHNQGINDNSQSNVYMSNCYLAGKGTFKASHYGPSSKLSYAYLNNNSLGSPIINRYETSDTTTPKNFKVVEYLNEVRS